MYCIVSDLLWFPAALRKPDLGQLVLVSGGLAKWDGMYWHSMTGEDTNRRITWDVVCWAELPKIPDHFKQMENE
jgi:hypothetical protein